MTRIEIKPRRLNASAEKVFDWLSDFRNFEPLMPESVKDWKATPTSCTLRLGNLGKISMEQKELSRPNQLKIGDSNAKPFPFILWINILEVDADTCDVGIAFEAKLNPFLKIIVEKPLEGFLAHLLKTAQERLNQGA